MYVGFPLHLYYLPRNIMVIENLYNLDRLPARGHIMMVLPIKILDGSGAPARVLAAPIQWFNQFSNKSSSQQNSGILKVFVLVYVAYEMVTCVLQY